MMVVLLLYPLRKRLRFMRGWLKLGSWFRLHMLLGVLGPLCILLHCNFRLGSTNSTVALACMLLVAGSGLIGRYLYGKFHFGLYGQQVGLHELKSDLDYIYRELETCFPRGCRASGSEGALRGLLRNHRKPAPEGVFPGADRAASPAAPDVAPGAVGYSHQ